MGRRVRPAKVSIDDLLEPDGRFKRLEDLPRKVRRELESFKFGADGRITGFRFRSRSVAYRLSAKRRPKKKRFTKAMDLELARRLEREAALIRGLGRS